MFLKDSEESKFIILGQIVLCGTSNTDTCLKSIEVLFNNDTKNVSTFPYQFDFFPVCKGRINILDLFEMYFFLY